MTKISKQTIYVETSIISYFTAIQSRDILIFARQQITQDWWNDVLPKFEAFISPAVIEEISDGDRQASQLRLKAASSFKVLEINNEVINLTQKILKKFSFPDRAKSDALHIAFPVVHKIDYLVTWNCKHIANAFTLKMIEKLILDNGYQMPTITTPNEFMEDPNE
ncbi:MAG: type II toxin-antitoxin system VapC family toxin [Candidatus Riflebacteria bacterium]|nr:type II toxin-antitoxin system VapC family toxin [Candidatus Riflebacteria bacterium]